MAAGLLLWTSTVPRAQAQDARTLLKVMLHNDDAASAVRGYYEYINEERSDRTGGHLWREKVVETTVGRVRFLLLEDGRPLSPAQEAGERGRLAQDIAHPEAFERREAVAASDDAHGRSMVALLLSAFLLDTPVASGEYIRIPYRPDPAYQPKSIEDRVMHGMSGIIVIDRAMMRLRELDGRADADVSLGFGPFAVVKAGSNFQMVREHEAGPDWKTESIHTDIVGRALILKSLSRKQDIHRWGYTRVSDSLTIAEAVALAER